jgi:glycosyltransferase involved in cell wall biosynthesis
LTAQREPGNLAPEPLPLRREAEVMATWRSEGPPVVSVICATHNHQAFLAAALQGVLAQVTEFPFELIVRDDASTDGTADVLREFSNRYPRIIRAVYETENTYRKGVKPAAVTYPMVRGAYIALCDGDDYWLDPRKLQTQHDFLRDNSEFVLCHHDVLVIDEVGGVRRPAAHGLEPRDASAEALQRGIAFVNSTLFFRNCISSFPVEFFRVVNGDIFLISLLGQHGKGRFLVSVAPAVYRQHRGGVWSMKSHRERLLSQCITALWLSHYYLRVPGAESLSKRQLGHAALLLLRAAAVPYSSRIVLVQPGWRGIYALCKEGLVAWQR